jgi:ABC-2 type transport system ATP-binding protein
MSGTALQARGLVKRFGDLTAVNGLDLEVRTGTCLALLGPNGAGKTTTIEMLEGLTRPDQGTIKVLVLTWAGQAQEIRERIGVQLQETRLTEKITAKETLRLFKSFYAQSRSIEEALGIVKLEDKANDFVETLSGGQQQRLTLACALISKPSLLFLDEPTTGLDPQARRNVWDIVESFKSEGGTVLLTTHYMEEAERLSEEVVIVDEGRVIAEGSPQGVIGRLEAESIVELHPRDGGAQRLEDAQLLGLPGVRDVRRAAASITLSVTDTQASVGALLGLLGEQGIALETLQTHAPTLEDVFMDLTGRHLRDA